MRRHLLLGLILFLGGCGGSGSGPEVPGQPSSRVEGVSARGAGPQPAPILYRTGTGRWYVADSVGASGPLSDAQFTYGGDATDLPVTGDFDGDGRRDVGVYRRATGRWYLLTAWAGGLPVADMKVDFGGDPSDVPFVGDWDGDGRDDLGVYRSATGEWRLPSGNFRIAAEADALPLAGDFDGDGRTDVGLFTPDTGRWRLDVTRDGVPDRTFVYGGQPSDFPLSADFDGDGDDDPALYRRDTGQWFLLTGLDGSTITGDVQLRYGGHPSDIPVLGDYNADGSADPGVYRREGGAWFLLTGRSGSQTLSDYQFVYGGDGSDLPVTSPAFYDLLPGGHRLALALDIDPVKPVLAAGSGTAITAWATYVFAQRAPVAADWSSSNDGVARVVGNQLEGLAQGTAALTARSGSVEASTPVTVVPGVAGSAGFRVGVNLPDGATANAILDADLDLFPDLVGMASGSTPWWRHNNGDRTFGDKIALPAGNRSDFFDVRTGDVNGDGLQDVLARNHSDVATWLHLAGGGFATPVTATSATDFGSHWVIQDVNGDGRQDLLTNSGPNLAVRLSRGDGTWNTPLARSLPDGAGQFAVGDLDADGELDVAVAGSTGVSVCRGNGDGTFTAPVSYAMTPAPLGVAVGDFDGDGRADVAASAQGAAEVRFFPGHGDGTLGSGRTLTVGAVPTGLRAVGTTLVVECKDADFVELWSAGPTLRKRMGATFYRSPEWAQMDGAGPLDLLSTDLGGSYLVFDEESPEVTSLGAGGGTNGGSIAVGDLDRDGTPDVVTSVVDQSKVSVLVGGTQVDYFVPDSAFVVRLVDVDGDGLLDLLAWVGSRLVLLRGHGDGTLTPAAIVASPTNAVGKEMEVADLDGDGDLDVVVGSSGQVSALLGDGDGYFSTERPLQMLVPGLRSINAGSLALADFNADGRVDVAIGEEWGNHVDVKLGNGDGTFGPAIGYFSGADSGIPTLVTGDLTGDGVLDLVAGSRNGILRVLAGNGDGSFANGVANATTASTITGLRLADLDRDGDLDVVGVANASNKPHRGFWLLGNGTATLGPVTHTPGGAMPSALELADMDRDARLDAVWVDPKSNAVWRMLGADS